MLETIPEDVYPTTVVIQPPLESGGNATALIDRGTEDFWEGSIPEAFDLVHREFRNADLTIGAGGLVGAAALAFLTREAYKATQGRGSIRNSLLSLGGAFLGGMVIKIGLANRRQVLFDDNQLMAAYRDHQRSSTQ